MTVLQFSLFFVALLVGYVLVHLRLSRFEEHLQKLGSLRSLDERLRVLVDAIEKLKFDGIEERLDRLHDDLEDLREATSHVREAVVQIPAAPLPTVSGGEAAALPAAAMSPDSPAARVLALVETRLLGLGYRNVSVLSDLTAVSEHGDADVQVECEQGGMPAKGRVQVRNFGVRDVALQSVAPMFP
ncbi:MAG: hypothetical protein KDE27_13845 [Planctomycetes bacterium]|nr:hypothetical protein [Planctomycetota bacterium]